MVGYFLYPISDIFAEIIQCDGGDRAHADRTIVNTSRLQALPALLTTYLFLLKPDLFLWLTMHLKISVLPHMKHCQCFLIQD